MLSVFRDTYSTHVKVCFTMLLIVLLLPKMQLLIRYLAVVMFKQVTLIVQFSLIFFFIQHPFTKVGVSKHVYCEVETARPEREREREPPCFFNFCPNGRIQCESSIIFQKVRISMFMYFSCYQNVFRQVFTMDRNLL